MAENKEEQRISRINKLLKKTGVVVQKAVKGVKTTLGTRYIYSGSAPRGVVFQMKSGASYINMSNGELRRVKSPEHGKQLKALSLRMYLNRA